MRSRHVVVGAGPVGSRVAALLAGRGEEVVVLTRRGSGPAVPGVTCVAGDATDVDTVVHHAQGAASIVNCANPAYHRWPQDWPPLAAALLAGAEKTGATLVTCSNLYGYGPPDHPMVETDPYLGNAKGQIRVRMWQDALAAHEAGRVRATEARGSDYLGAGPNSLFGDLTVPRILRGRPVFLTGDLDVPHTFTYVEDMAATLTRLVHDERAWGRAWHVPSDVTCTQREAVAALAAGPGVGAPRIVRVPWSVVRGIGLAVPLLRELRHTRYQWDAPFVMDSSAARTELGLTATPPEQIWSGVVAQYRPAAVPTGSYER